MELVTIETSNVCSTLHAIRTRQRCFEGVLLRECLLVIPHIYMWTTVDDRHGSGGIGRTEACDRCQPLCPHACVRHGKSSVSEWSCTNAHTLAPLTLLGKASEAPSASGTPLAPIANAHASVWLVASSPAKFVNITVECDSLRSHEVTTNRTVQDRWGRQSRCCTRAMYSMCGACLLNDFAKTSL